MSVTPSTRQKKLGMLAWRAFEEEKLLWIKPLTSLDPLPKEPVRVKLGNYGDVYYGFTLNEWAGCQHIDYIIIDGRIYL